MDTALVPASGPAPLTAAEKNRFLRKSQSELRGGNRLPFIPQIKMKNVKNPLDQFQKGEWYTVEEDQNGEKVFASLGTDPEVVVVARRYSYSIYDQDEEKLVAWSNELDGFSQNHVICIVSIRGGQPEIAFQAPYPEFSAKKEELQHALGGRFKFQNVLYVLYKGKVYQLFVSNASVTGVRDGEKSGSYQDAQPGSFEDFKNNVVASESDCYFYTRCKLGSKYLPKNEYYVMTFTVNGQVEDRAKMLDWYAAVCDGLEKRFMLGFGPLLAGKDKAGGVIDVEKVARDLA